MSLSVKLNQIKDNISNQTQKHKNALGIRKSTKLSPSCVHTDSDRIELVHQEECRSSLSSSQPPPTPSSHRREQHPPASPLVKEILVTVAQLERSLIAEHRNDFDLRMALEQQNEKLCDLRTSLETEKMRNQRLVQLIRGVDSSSSAEDDEDCYGKLKSRWPSRSSSIDTFDSISPLLMQHRYDELSISYRQCRGQLAKKDKILVLAKCEKEELQARYDYLFDEFRSMQKRLEELCSKYLSLQGRKSQEIHKLKEALNCASRCLLNITYTDTNICCDEYNNSQFKQNFQLFVNALRECASVNSLKI